MFSFKIITNMSDFHSIEVVGRGGETQLQVGEIRVSVYSVRG